MMKKILCMFTLAVLIVSCTNELPFDIEDKPAKLIVTTLLEADKGDNTIILALTGKDKVTYVNDATVNVYINDQLKESISGSSDNKGCYKSVLRFKAGDRIKVEALTKDGLYHAWGEATVPAAIAIEKLDKESIMINTSISKSKYLRLKTTFSDNSADRNYYRIGIISMQVIDGISLYSGMDTTIVVNTPEDLIIREDIVLTDGRATPINTDDGNILDPVENKYGVFDNAQINGSYTMTVSVLDYFDYNPDYINYLSTSKKLRTILKIQTCLKVKLQSISETQYYYLKALNIYDSDNYDPKFDLPIKFSSNINGGTGIIGVSSESSEIIRFSDYNIYTDV